MNHEVAIVESRQVNGLVAVAAECCGDPSTKSWHAMAPSILDDPERFEQSVSGHLQRVANQHEVMLQGKAVLSGLVGQIHVFDSHTAKFKHFKQLSDGQLTIGAHCCGDESTLSWHIIDSSAAADPTICQNTIKEHCQQTANKHETTKRCLAALPGLVGREFKIDTTANASAVPVAAAATATPQQVEAA